MRKVLSFVLVLALVLGSFSFAFGLTDIEDSANKDAIQVCNDLGIIDGYPDGTFQGEKAVNRAEFAAMITRALGVPDSALAGYATTSFKDVAGYGWAVPYLAFCESKGIMLGDGMGNAMPGRTISVNEAITMALRAVGYTENSAMLVGSWPANYVTLGQQQGLYTDLATATTIDRENAAQVIYNVLTVDLVAVNADGTTNPVGGPNPTMIEAYQDATSAPGIILGTGWNFTNSVIKIVDKLGALGTGYTKDGELVAFKTDSDSVKLEGYVNSSNKFVVGDTKYDLSRVTGTSFAFTNAAVSTGGVTFVANAALNAAALTAASVFADDGETLILNADISGNYIEAIHSVVAWLASNDAKAASDVQEDIEDAELLGFAFEQDTNDNIKDNSFLLKGVDSLDKIKKNDVVAVYADADYIRMVTVGTEVVEGTVDEVGTDFFMLDGKKYEMSALAGAAGLPSVNEEGTFNLDYEGNVYAYDTTGDTDTFGVVTLYSKTAGSLNNEEAIQVYTQEGTLKTYDFADSLADIAINAQATTSGATSTGGIVTPALISYALDADGAMDVIDGRADYASVTAIQIKTNLIARVGGFDTPIADDAKVFVYDVTAKNDFKVKTVADLVKNAALTGPGLSTDTAQIYVNDDGEVAALLVDKTALDATTGDFIFGVFNTVTEVKDGTTDVLKLVGFVDGKEVTLLTDNRTPALGAVNTMKQGNLLTITPDALGVAQDVTTSGAFSSGTFELGAGYTVTRGGVDGLKITCTNATIITVAEDVVVYKYDATTKKFTVSDMSDLSGGKTILSAFDSSSPLDGEVATDNVADIIVFK